MTTSTSPQPDPSAVGGIQKATFAILPDPSRLFARRAERFDGIAGTDSPLAPYLRFLAAIGRAQGDLVIRLPAPEPIPVEQRERAREHAMPPLDRGTLAGDAVLHATLGAFFEAAEPIEMPPVAGAALGNLRRDEPQTLMTMIDNLALDAVPYDGIAAHLFVSAGMQVHAARLAATLDANALAPVGIGLCPVCGGPPLSSMVVGFLSAEGTRYASCSFCGTLWNEVRIKCLACGSTKGIGYRAVEGDEKATVKAEVCDACRSWVKILYQNKNASLDAVADDVGTVGLDMLMRETEYRRAGFNPYLVGY